MSGGRLRGFSLIELMTTIAVLAILLALSAPTFTQWSMNSRIRNVAEAIQNGLRLARNEASQRGINTRFEFDAANRSANWTVCQLDQVQTTCAASAQSAIIEKWNANGGSADVLIATSKDPAQLTTSAFATALTAVDTSAQGVTFSALGRPQGYGAASFLRTDADVDTGLRKGSRRMIISVSAGGQVRMCDPDPRVQNLPQGCPHA